MKQPLEFSPDADLNLEWDWTAWLAGASVASVTITPPAGVALADQSQLAGVVTVFVTLTKKMVEGTLLPIRCHVTTNDTPARVDTRTITLIVTNR